ncbi:MAG TPA: SET domain-containing protein [Candidatus Paceibacterota bacterium]|nr:SET domain-containing protein [Candidatus Paceibacterota bacterium]
MSAAHASSDVVYRVKRSRTGLGLFATKDIRKGKTIIEYIGYVLDPSRDDERSNRYIFNVNKKKDIDGSPRWNIARYVNHACRPNSEAIDRGARIFYAAKRNITAGEEITVDYGKEYWNDWIKPHGCLCDKCLEKKSSKKGAKTSVTRAKKTTRSARGAKSATARPAAQSRKARKA